MVLYLTGNIIILTIIIININKKRDELIKQNNKLIDDNLELIEKNIYFMTELMSAGMQNVIDKMNELHNKETEGDTK